MTIIAVITFIVFCTTYIFIITEWINKMLAAMIGGFLIIIMGVLSQESAVRYIEWNVIFLLIGMMIVMGVLRQTGVFHYIAIKTVKLAKGSPLKIILLLSLVTAIISAFLDNVTTVMILVPITILITNELRISPVPFVIHLTIASNIGGTATLIGDPPNILIGSVNNFSFIDFIINLTPLVAINMAVMLIIVYFMFRKTLRVSNERRARIMEFKEREAITDFKLLHRSLIVVAITMLAFLFQEVIHLQSGTIAMSAGLTLMLLSNRKEVESIFAKDIDWATIFFFIGLFILVGSLEVTGILHIASNLIMRLTQGHLAPTAFSLLWFSGLSSSIFGSVPIVAVMVKLILPIVAKFNVAGGNVLWWSLALGACLGGNGTLIGAAANIIAISICNRSGHHISFKQFTVYGFFNMLVSLMLSSLYIWFRYLM